MSHVRKTRGLVKVKGQPQPETAAEMAAFLILEAWFWEYGHFFVPGFDFDSSAS